MAGSRYGRCPGCKRQVLRLHHAVTGRLGLLEPAPHKEGRFRVQHDEDGRTLLGTYTTAQADVDEDGPLYRSHFASCPVDRPRPRRTPTADDVDDQVEEERCCYACGYRLHDDLFRPDMPAVYRELHPLCIPDDRLAELGDQALQPQRVPVMA